MKLFSYSGNSSMTPMRVKKKKWKFRGTPLLPLLISQFNRQTVIRLYPFVYTTLCSRTSGQKTVRIIFSEASRMCVARHHHLITNSELQPPCVVIFIQLKNQNPPSGLHYTSLIPKSGQSLDSQHTLNITSELLMLNFHLHQDQKCKSCI